MNKPPQHSRAKAVGLKNAKSGRHDSLVAISKEEARDAGLRYSLDSHPGIRRRRRKGENKFSFIEADGRALNDRTVLERIRSLAIPPAWEEVWICSSENGHLQATGRDSRGRKQYRYHPAWRSHRDENKFKHITAFARALPKIRQQVRRDLGRDGMPREKVLATIVRLLEATLIRVGNEEYARSNGSYGLTTMQRRHARVSKNKVEFAFRGKSGKSHHIILTDQTLARIVKRCQDMPGEMLFEYEDEAQVVHPIASQDVNDYIRSITDQGYTAKDFRTWGGTVLAAVALREFKEPAGKAEAKKNIVSAIETVARMLGNTPAVCRKCYIHPAILEAYLSGTTISTTRRGKNWELNLWLSNLKTIEAAVIRLLKTRLKPAVKKITGD